VVAPDRWGINKALEASVMRARMAGDNGQPAVGDAGSDERVSTAALVAAMELIRGMSENPAATQPTSCWTTSSRQRSALRSSRRRSRPFSLGFCRCSATLMST
jgi:hypothetical protein